MKGPAPSSTRVVTDRTAAAVLTDPMALRCFSPFLGRSCTIKDAAEASGANPNTLYHRVQRWLAMGLLRVAGEQPRRGRAIKLYRSVSDRFFVPFEAFPEATLEEAMARLDQPWEQALRWSVVRARREAVETWGYEIYRGEQGGIMVGSARAAGQEVDFLGEQEPAVLSVWNEEAYLTQEEAKALQHHLFSLLQPGKRRPGTKRFLLRIAIAPLREE